MYTHCFLTLRRDVAAEKRAVKIQPGCVELAWRPSSRLSQPTADGLTALIPPTYVSYKTK